MFVAGSGTYYLSSMLDLNNITLAKKFIIMSMNSSIGLCTTLPFIIRTPRTFHEIHSHKRVNLRIVYIFALAVKESTCKQTGTGRANGDPHYHSFDMKMIHFQGKWQGKRWQPTGFCFRGNVSGKEMAADGFLARRDGNRGREDLSP